ncbi:MAG: hypothetical protein AAF202_04815, partial [Pseudomonadota bacterium]
MRTLLLLPFFLFGFSSLASFSVIEEYVVRDGSEACFDSEYVFIYDSPDGSEMRVERNVDGVTTPFRDFVFAGINTMTFDSTAGEAGIPVSEFNLRQLTSDGYRLISKRFLTGAGEVFQETVLSFGPGTMRVSLS